MQFSVNGNSKIGGAIAAFVGLIMVAWGGITIITDRKRNARSFIYTGKVIERDRDRKMVSFSSRSRDRYRRRREYDYYLTVAWTVDDRDYRERFAVDSRSFYNAHGIGSTVKLAPDGLDPADAELIQPVPWSSMLALIAVGVLLMGFGGYAAARGDADLKRLLERQVS